MELSDRRSPELLAFVANRHRGRGVLGLAARPAAPRMLRFVSRVGIGPMDDEKTRRGAPPARVDRAVKEVLLVEPDTERLRGLRSALGVSADVQTCSNFQAARERLLSRPPDLLVTNIRLEAFNGLQLVHLAAGLPTRCIAYAAYDDLVLAREVQAAGAFYERPWRLPRALTAYVQAVLPPYDRRNPNTIDQRDALRGGRRSTDHYV